MGIITLCRKNIYFVLLISLFAVMDAAAQCPTVTNSNQSFCDIDSPTISSLAATNNGGGVFWYATATSTTPLSASTGLVNGEDYFADDNTGACGVRPSVTVSIFMAPTGQNFQGVCVGIPEDATIADLIANGNNIQWYSQPNGGVPLSPTTVLVDNTIYYASQTNPNTGCETSRLSVFVNVGVVPTPTGDPTQEFCNDPSAPAPTVGDLVASGANNWYLTSSSAVPLALSTPLINGQSYFATTVDPPCESTTRFEVVVTLLSPNDAGSDGIIRICANQVASTPPFNLFNLLGGTPDTTGTWSGPLATSNGHLGTVNVSTLTVAGSPYTFTYNVGGLCPPDSSTVTIIILPLPVVTIASNTTICSGNSATVTFTGTPNATVTYNINGGASQTIVLNASGTASITTTYTATTTYNLVSVSSATTPSCSQTATGTATVTVLPLPIATIAANTTICSGNSATVTFTGTPNATVTYTVNGGANQTIVLNPSGTASITGNYTATTTFSLVSIVSAGTPACTRPLSGSAVITVIPPPVVAISGSASVCPNGTASVTFTGTPNATVTYTVNGGANQTIVLNASGTAVINTTYTSTTTYALVSIATAGTPSCSQPQSGSVTITVLPLPTATIAANTTVCSGASATVTFTGTPNATVTYNINGGANQTIVLNGSGTATISGTFTANTTYNLVSVASAGTPSCSQPQTGSITITVIPLPVVSISTNTSVCSGGSATVTFTGTPNATVTYNINGGASQTIVLNASGTATITNIFTATTIYNIVSIANSGTPSCSQPQSGSMTVTVIPLPVVTISASATTICSGANATVTFTGTPNATVTYTVNGGANQTIVLNASGTATVTGSYTASTTFALVGVATSGTPTCTQPQTGSVTINIVPLPVAAISTNTTVCTGGSATVTFTGTPNATVTYTVNGGANQTIVLTGSGTATITNTYTATTTFTLVSAATTGTPACTQPQAGSMTITVVPPSVVTIAANSTICAGASATVTFTGTPNATVTYNINGGANQTIVLSAAGTATITNTYTSTTTFNLVNAISPGTPSCAQPQTGSVTVTVVQLPTVTISGSASVCPNGAASITFTGTPNATVTYTINGGANQTIVLNASGTAVINGTFSTTTVYTLVSAATSGTPACTQPQSGSATITVLPVPVVSISSNTTVCSGGSATVTFTGTPNAIVTYTINGGANQTITLSASGTATITNTYTSTTTFTLVSVSTAGTPGCTQPQSGSVVITVVPPPTVAISGSASVCPGGSATVTFTGTPGATVTYNLNGGASQTIVLNAAGTVTITNTYTATTTFNVESVATSGTPACTQPQTGSVTITVVPVPTAAISSAVTAVCAGTSATVTFTGTANAQVTYTVNGGPNQTITLSASGTASVSTTLNVNTTYTLVSASTTGTPACSQLVTGSVTISATPPPVAGNDVAAFAICGNATPVDLFTLLGASAQPGGTWSPALASGSGVFDPAVDAAGTYTYTVAGNAPCPSDTASVAVSIVPPPNAGTDATVNFCSNSGSQNLFSQLGGAQPGGAWSPATSSGSGIFNPLTDAPGVYTYTVTGNAPCGSDTATVTVTVTPAAQAGTDGTLSICANAASQDLFNALGGTPQTGGSWSPALASGSGIFNPAVDAAGTYVYTVTGTAPCVNASASVTVSIVQPPIAGNDAVVNTCSNSDPQDLFAQLGASAQNGGTWSPALASGTGVFNPAVDTAGTYTYTVAGSAPCGSDSAVVTVTVTPGPDAGLDGTMTLCADSPTQDLFTFLNGTPQSGGTWSPALASGSGIFDPAVDAPGVYTYTFFGSQPCDNDTATVTVTVNPIPDAGNDGTAFFCTNYPASDLFASLTGTPQTGGTWAPALASGTGIFNPLVDPAGTYTYSVGGGLCSTDAATVTVTVVQSPNAGGVGATLLINSCVTSTSVDLFSGLNGTQGAGTWNDDDATGALSGNNFNPTVTGPGSFHFTYTVGGGVSPCLFDTATVTVVVVPIPNAGTFGGVQSVCSSAGTFNLVNLLDGSQQSGGVWTDALGVVLADPIITISGLSGGTYNYTYTITNACGTDAETVSLTILPVPTLSIPNITIITPICLGDNASLNLNGLADGNYTIAYNLSGANTASDQSVTVTVAGGTATFNIPSAIITNTGTTTITFTGIQNTVTGCSSVLNNVLVNFVVRPLSNLDSANLTVANACLGTAIAVNISGATGLTDGNYQFGYTITGATPSTGTTGIVAIAAGAGSFVVPASAITTAGNYTIAISNIVSLSNSCNNLSEDASATFEIYAAPDVAGATVDAADACLGFSNEISITGADNLADGTYTITYQLSGASAFTGTSTVTFTAGDTVFNIPASELTAMGNVTVTITQLLSSPGACGANVTSFNTITFEVLELETPVLIPEGNEFCATDNPTIADLTSNVTGSGTVVWYNAATGGTAYNNSDPLVQGATYYAALTTTSGCESPVRLEVTADLTACENIIIPDGFSPNGDTINDEFVIINLPELYPNFRLEIYNRYGNILYKGNINTPNWNGTTSEGGIKLGDGVVPTGVYFFIIEFNDGSTKPMQGRLYLSR